MKHTLIGIEITPERTKKRAAKPPKTGTRMSGQTISVKVTSEAEGELVIETRESSEEIYRLCPHRTMDLHVGQLHLSSDVNPLHFSDENLGVAGETALFVRGTATLEDGSISVIGDVGSKARTLTIDFYALDDEVWCKHKESAQMMGKAPHYTLAKVGLARHHPDGGADAWFVQCQVPPPMLHALARAVSCGAIGSINVTLALRGIYSRAAGVLQSGSSGWFLRPNCRDNTVETPETAYGSITLLNFEETQTELPPEAMPQIYASREAIPELRREHWGRHTRLKPRCGPQNEIGLWRARRA